MSVSFLHAGRISAFIFASLRPQLRRSRLFSAGIVSLFAFSAAVVTLPANAQDAAPATPGKTSGQEPVRTETTQFAPGVVSVIAPAPHADETFAGPTTLQSLIDAHPEIEWGAPDFVDGRPNFDARTRTLIEMARQVIYRREIYSFEFSFKPLRQIYIDVPQPSGKMARKLVWYMV